MVTEVVNTSTFPYSAIVSIRATYANGKVSLGTGTLVGKNDVLTATHVVYQPEYGGYATSIQVYPGADYNGTRGIMESAPYGSYFSGSVVGFPSEAFSDGNSKTTSLIEVSSDVAIIGLDKAVGFDLGWFGLAQGYNTGMWATEVGYPGDGTGMMMGPSYAYSNNGLWISAYNYDGSVLLGPGSSGGPLFIEEDNLPSIIGVKSSGNGYVNYWADIDHKYDALQAAMRANDHLVGRSTFLVGTETRDFFTGSLVNQVIDGLSGMDSISYAASVTQYKVFTTGNQQTNVVNTLGLNRGDTLTNIERIQFTDASIALDIGSGENAGSAYRLYKAALDRTPDPTGLGFWITALDNGESLRSVASSFVDSPEFRNHFFGDGSNTAFVTALYNNVLGRAPEQDGFDFWLNSLNSGTDRASVLVNFSESPENQGNTSGLIANGISYQEWLG